MKRPSPTAQRLASLHDGVNRLGPQTVHLDITNSCNTDCITCWDHSPLLDQPRDGEWKRRRVTADDVTQLLDDVQTLGGLESVILSGMGEPFTHPDIYRMIADVKRRGLHLTIITNLVAADAEQVLSLGVDQLLIGVHGASERAYLDFHPSFTSAHWQRLHTALGRFHDAGRRFKHVQVIARCNAHELTEMVEQAHRYGAQQVNFKLASLARGTERARITDQQRAQMMTEGVSRAEARAAALGVETNLDVLRLQLEAGGEATAPIAEVGCFLGYHYSRVTVDGEVLYCCNTEVQVGQLHVDGRFSTLWRSEAWDALRDRMRRGEYFPGCEQCGKFNQNVKLSERFRAVYGEERWREVTGRGAGARPKLATHALRVLP
ncbi:MAG: radical SAM protein [Myxococcota bacterium]